jgi:hypothetical protein
MGEGKYRLLGRESARSDIQEAEYVESLRELVRQEFKA